MDDFGFNCDCTLCKEEILKSDEEKYKQFHKFRNEAKVLSLERENQPLQITLEKLNNEIWCYKEMYKFAQEKRASRQYILRDILVKGWETAFTGYNIFDQYAKKIQNKAKTEGNFSPSDSKQLIRDSTNAKKFKEECDKFCKIGEHLSKIVYSSNGSLYLQWIEKKEYFDAKIKKAQEQLNLARNAKNMKLKM